MQINLRKQKRKENSEKANKITNDFNWLAVFLAFVSLDRALWWWEGNEALIAY